MESKKRRNSILKQPGGQDDDTTTDITAVRNKRVSFGGKKSVREFRTEKEITTWQNTYEVSASSSTTEGDDTAHSEMSGLVDVHRKQIMLRNRRVLCESKSKQITSKKSQQHTNQQVKNPAQSTSKVHDKSENTSSTLLHTKEVSKTVTYSSVVIAQGLTRVEQPDLTLMDIERARLNATNMNNFHSFWVDSSEISAMDRRTSMESTKDFQVSNSNSSKISTVAEKVVDLSMMAEQSTENKKNVNHDSEAIDLSFTCHNESKIAPRNKFHDNTRFSCAMDFDTKDYGKPSDIDMHETKNDSIDITMGIEGKRFKQDTRKPFVSPEATATRAAKEDSMMVEENPHGSRAQQLNSCIRKTIYFNDYMDIESDHELPNCKMGTIKETTKHLNDHIEPESFRAPTKEPIFETKGNLRRTLHFDSFIEEESFIKPIEECSLGIRTGQTKDTKQYNDQMEKESMKNPIFRSNTTQPKGNICKNDNDQEKEEPFDIFSSEPRGNEPKNDLEKTKYFNDHIEKESVIMPTIKHSFGMLTSLPKGNKRATMLFDDQIEEESVHATKYCKNHMEQESFNEPANGNLRRSIHFNDHITEESLIVPTAELYQPASIQETTKHGNSLSNDKALSQVQSNDRRTIHFNNDIEKESFVTPRKESSFLPKSQTNATTYLNDHKMEESMIAPIDESSLETRAGQPKSNLHTTRHLNTQIENVSFLSPILQSKVETASTKLKINLETTRHYNDDIEKDTSILPTKEFSFSTPPNQATNNQCTTLPFDGNKEKESSFGILASQPSNNQRTTLHFYKYTKSPNGIPSVDPLNESPMSLPDVTPFEPQPYLPKSRYNESSMLTDTLSPILPPEYAAKIKTPKRMTLREINDAFEKGIIPVLHTTPKPPNAQNKHNIDKENLFKVAQPLDNPTKISAANSDCKSKEQNMQTDSRNECLPMEDCTLKESLYENPHENDVDAEDKFSATIEATNRDDKQLKSDNISMPSPRAILEESECDRKLASKTKIYETKVNATLVFEQNLATENLLENELYSEQQEQAKGNATIYYNESLNVPVNHNENPQVEDCNKSEVYMKNQNTIYYGQDCAIDINCDTIYSNSAEKAGSIRTMHFDADKSDMCLDEDVAPNAELNKKESPKEQLTSLMEDVRHLSICADVAASPIDQNINAAAEHPSDSLEKELEQLRKISRSIRFPQNIVDSNFTPERIIKARTIYEGTPHRSIMEFEAMELEVKENEDVQRHRRTTYETVDLDLDVSKLPPMNAAVALLSKKRPTILLTPNLPSSKKRQTKLFACEMEASPEGYIEYFSQEDKTQKRQTKLFSSDMTLEPDDNNADVMKITEEIGAASIAFMESAIKEATSQHLETKKDSSIEPESFNNKNMFSTPINKKGISRIPVYSGSAKKNSVNKRYTYTIKQQSPIGIDQSLGTIQEPRALAFNHSLNATRSNAIEFKNHTQNQSELTMLEDRPITISDVSEYYLKIRDAVNFTADKSIRCSDLTSEIKTLELPKCDSKEICIEDISANGIGFEAEAECETNANTENHHQRLSRVEMLLQGNSVDEIIRVEDECAIENCLDLDDCTFSRNNGEEKENSQIVLCNKCKRCQQTLNESSFNIPSMIDLNDSNPGLPPLNLERLKRLQEIPTVDEVAEYYLKQELKLGLNMANLRSSVNADIERKTKSEPNSADIIIARYKDNINRKEDELLKRMKENPYRHLTFAKHLGNTVKTRCSNWIYNSKKDFYKLLVFRHTKIITFAINLKYEKQGRYGNSVKIKSVELIHDSCFPTSHWLPLDYLLDYQLRLELPSNLLTLCEGDTVDGVIHMLEKIDKICMDIWAFAKSLVQITNEKMCELKRDHNQVFIEKVIRHIRTEEGSYPRVLRTIIRIDIFNMRNISYRNIVAPPSHMLHEDLQFLPSGLEFLQSFLKNPLRT